jgi:hypothetical protein
MGLIGGLLISAFALIIIILAAMALIRIFDYYGPACGSAAAVAFIFLCVMIGTAVAIAGIL